MDSLINELEWRASNFLYARELLGLSCYEVFDETGIDPYFVENRKKTSRDDKTRLAMYYNRLLRQAGHLERLSVFPPKRTGGKSNE